MCRKGGLAQVRLLLIETKEQPEPADSAQRSHPPDVKVGRRTVLGAVQASPEKQQTKERTTVVKTKTTKQPKQAKPTVQLKDMKPKKDSKGGYGPEPGKQPPPGRVNTGMQAIDSERAAEHCAFKA